MINLTQLHLMTGSEAAANLTKIVSNLAMQQQLEQSIKNAFAKGFEENNKLMNSSWNYLLEGMYQKHSEAEELRQASINQKETSWDIEGLGKKFDVSKTTIHNWIKRGWIKGKKVGKARFFDQSDIDELIKMGGMTLGS